MALRPTIHSCYNRLEAFLNDSIANCWHLSGPVQFGRHYCWQSKARHDRAIAAKKWELFRHLYRAPRKCGELTIIVPLENLMSLSCFIRGNLESILQAWEDFARTIEPPALTMDSKASRDHASNVLTTIATNLDQPRAAGGQRGTPALRIFSRTTGLRILRVARKRAPTMDGRIADRAQR